MNKNQKRLVKYTKIEMKAHNINFYQGRKKARKEIRSIGDMLVKRYGFKRK